MTALEDHKDGIRRTKEKYVADDDGKPDIPTMVSFLRDGKSIAMAMTQPDRDNMLRIIGAGCAYLDPDEVIAHNEAYYSMFSSEKDARLRSGALSEMWERGEREGISECIVVTHLSKTGVSMDTMPYVVSGTELTWDEEITEPAYTNVQGVMPEFFQSVWGNPDIKQEFDASAVEFSQHRLDGVSDETWYKALRSVWGVAHLSAIFSGVGLLMVQMTGNEEYDKQVNALAKSVIPELASKFSGGRMKSEVISDLDAVQEWLARQDS